MQKTIWIFIINVAILIAAPSCNSNKIACPTYADSFPEKQKKKSDKPEAPKALPKASKSNRSHSMGPR